MIPPPCRSTSARLSRLLLATFLGVLPIATPVHAGPDTTPPKAPDKETAERIKKEAKGVLGPAAAPAADPSAGSPQDARGWSVVVASIRGDDRDAIARVALQRARSEGQLPDAYSARRGEAVVIAVGDFPGPDDPNAQAELRRIQQIVVGGLRPYALAFLSPPPQGPLPGNMPQYNLLRAKEVYGPKMIYTLQVAVYGRLDVAKPSDAELAEARKAAEQAAYRLRQEGEIAYYYHSPTLSMVTVGVFDTSDFDPQVPSYKSEPLRAAQKRHPYNLYNGQGIKEKRKGAPERLQASNLVLIPDK